MLKRLLPALAIALLPLTAGAEDMPAPVPDPSVQSGQPAPVQSQSSTGQSGIGSSGVQGSQTAPAAGGASTDGTALQPSAGAGLGSMSTDSTGLVAPTVDPLQAPTTNTDQLRVLLGSEIDGAQHDITDESAGVSDPLLDLLAVLLFIAIIAGCLILRRRQLVRARARYAHID